MIQFSPKLKLNKLNIQRNGTIVTASEENIKGMTKEEIKNFSNAIGLAQKEYFMLRDSGMKSPEAKKIVIEKYIINFNKNLSYPVLSAKLKSMPKILTEEEKETLFNHQGEDFNF